MINKETIDKILDSARIEEVVGDFVALKKRGVNLLGNCPFHNEKTPSFTVSAAKGIFKCFGCGKAGNSVHFIMEHEHFTYPEALKYLAKKYSIEVDEEEITPQQQIEQS
ncbi:MAG: DNA primase, partial [Bacteroidetes bacterium]|nr:DNA primase [Bacteroidota bacterium]